MPYASWDPLSFPLSVWNQHPTFQTSVSLQTEAFSSCAHFSNRLVLHGIWPFSQETVFPFHNVTTGRVWTPLGIEIPVLPLISTSPLCSAWESPAVRWRSDSCFPQDTYSWVPGALTSVQGQVAQTLLRDPLCDFQDTMVSPLGWEAAELYR